MMISVQVNFSGRPARANFLDIQFSLKTNLQDYV